MEIWEYKVCYLRHAYIEGEVEKELNMLGKDGWELVTMYKEDGSLYAVLKRKKQ